MRFRGFIYCLILFSCGKINPANVSLIGHAGNGLTIPTNIYCDNTFPSFELALNTSGCDGIEMDLQLSNDGDIWLFHDFSLFRTTLKSKSLNEYSSQELRSANYTTIHREKLVQLADIDPLFYANKTYFFDIKLYNETADHFVDTATFLNKLIAFKQSHPTVNFICVTQVKDFAYRLKEKGFTVYFSYFTELEQQTILNQSKIFDGVMVQNARITPEQSQQWRNNEYKVAVFDIRSPKGVRKSLKLQADYLLVDDLKGALIEKY